MSGYRDDYLPPPPQPDYPDDFGYPPPPPEISRTYALSDDFPPPPPSGDDLKPVSVHKSSTGYLSGGYGEPRSSYACQSEVIQSPTGVIRRTAEKTSYSSHSGDGSDGSLFSRNYANVSSLKQSSSSSYQYKGGNDTSSRLPYDSRSERTIKSSISDGRIERAVPGPQVPTSWEEGVSIPIIVKGSELSSPTTRVRSYDSPSSPTTRVRSYDSPSSPTTRVRSYDSPSSPTTRVRSYDSPSASPPISSQYDPISRHYNIKPRQYDVSISPREKDFTSHDSPQSRSYQESSVSNRSYQDSSLPFRSYQDVSPPSRSYHESPQTSSYTDSSPTRSYTDSSPVRSYPESSQNRSYQEPRLHEVQHDAHKLRSHHESFDSSPTRSYQKPILHEDTGDLPLSQPYKQNGKSSDVKEAEVDALTNLLMQNMETTADADFFGTCSKCGKCVEGENNGCTAMEQVFHITCFTCVNCAKPLKGKSFYSMDNKPYCEGCYMNTLEKCSVCSKPVTDRLLRATGKPYHPACFTCVVCGKSLDGIPFTVDATSQIHCIEDFHKKFAPRCCVCHKPIMPDTNNVETVRVVAMDKSFHVQCYRCQDCGLLLSSEAEGRGCYPLDEHILCKNCNAQRIQAMTTKMTTEL
ncbi:hypothetical protein ScPMuIL_007696 [Solemya velum]